MNRYRKNAESRARLAYYASRYFARTALRRLDLVDQAAITDQCARQLIKSVTDAAARVPGGLTRPYRYIGTCLLPEWRERRQDVWLRVVERRKASRIEMRKAA